MPTKKSNKEPKKRYATHITTATGDRVYVSAKTQEDLDKKIAQLKAEMGAGVNISDRTLFSDYADMWLQVYKKPKIRQNTYDTLHWHVEHSIKPCFKGMLLRDIKPIHVQAFLASISQYSHQVQSSCLCTLRAIFLTAEDNGLILKSPVKAGDKATGAKVKEKEALTNEQVKQLLAAVKGTPAYLFCLLALTTGMRKSEILGLMWSDIDFDTGFINIRHSVTQSYHRPDSTAVSDLLKSEAAHRRVPMPLLLRVALEEERKNEKGELVFSRPDGQPLDPNSYNTMWKEVTHRTVSSSRPLGKTWHNNRLGRSYTVTLDFSCHPHLLRHTYITQLFESGLDIKQVQYLAGHSTPNMTLRVYTHFRRKQREQETADQVNAAIAYLQEDRPKVIALRA